MDPDIAELPERLARARQVLAFAEAAGDHSAIRIAGAVLIELLDQAGEAGPDTVRAAIPSPRETGGAS